MVDFNNEKTIGTPAVDVERISILQRRYDVLEALEDYQKKRHMGSDVPIAFVRARLFTLFVEIQAYLKRKLSPEDYNILYNICLDSKDENELISAIFKINEELDAMRLIRIDTQKVYDSTSAETENRMKRF